MKKFTCTVNNSEHTLQYDSAAGQYQLDGQAFPASAVELTSGWYSILIDGASFEVRVSQVENSVGGRICYLVLAAGEAMELEVSDPRKWVRGGGRTLAAGSQRITAPMPGKVVRVLVNEGEAVEAGESLIVIEAMKMQNEIRSSKSGIVAKVSAVEGQIVAAGQALLVID